MALHNLLWTKPPTPYFKPPPIHLCVVGVLEQRRVVSWDFDSTGAKPGTTKQNVLITVSDGRSVARVTVFEEFANKFKLGGNYMVRGYSMRGQSPPFMMNITRETMFFRSAPIEISQQLREQAEELLRPLSPLTPLATCRDAQGYVTVQGQVVELSTVKRITKGREVIPLQNIKLQQGETQVPVCLWREAAVELKLQIGTHVQVSHLKASNSEYGVQMQSTPFSMVEEVNSEATVGALGVMDVEGEPGTLNLLLEDGRMLLIDEELWGTVEGALIDPPLQVFIQLAGNRVTQIKTIEMMIEI